MDKKLGIFWILLYTLGLFLSQSLLSVAGLLAIASLWVPWQFWKPSIKNPATWGLAWVIVATLNIVLRRPEGHLWEALRNIPLILIPLIALQNGHVFSRILSQHPRWVKNILNLALFLVFLALCRSLYQGLVLKRPATGLMRNQIYFAYAMLPVFLFSAELALQEKLLQMYRARLALISLFSVIALVLSHTRMAWLLIILWAVFRGFPWLSRRRSSKEIIAVVGAGVLAVGFLFFYQPDFQNKVLRIFTSSDPSKVARAFIWSFNFNTWLQNPLLGIGYELNGMIPLADDVQQLFLNAGLNPLYRIYAHNIYLQALVDNGIIGFGLWMGFWITLARGRAHTSIYLLFMGIAGLTENFFNNSRAAHPFYFVTALMIVWDRIVSSQEKSLEQ